MAELHDPGQLALADVGRAGAEQVQVGLGGVEGVARARRPPGSAGPPRPPAGCPSPARPAARCPGRPAARGPARRPRPRSWSSPPGSRAPRSRTSARRGRARRRSGPAEVPTVTNTMSQLARSDAESTTFAPSSASGCGLGPGPVVDRDVAAGGEQPADKLRAHPPGSQPAEPMLTELVCHVVHRLNLGTSTLHNRLQLSLDHGQRALSTALWASCYLNADVAGAVRALDFVQSDARLCAWQTGAWRWPLTTGPRDSSPTASTRPTSRAVTSGISRLGRMVRRVVRRRRRARGPRPAGARRRPGPVRRQPPGPGRGATTTSPSSCSSRTSPRCARRTPRPCAA